ncbi:MAG: hypothetical protein OEZ39_05415 [Gammaproteobacteria bacterium]|nr:hypothetical protein [Gammaproteobacteria bacterium]
MFNKKIRLFLIPATLVISIAGCNNESDSIKNNESNKMLDEKLSKISFEIASIFSNIKINKDVQCAIADSFETQTSKSTGINEMPLMQEIFKKPRIVCDLNSMAYTYVLPTIEDIKKADKLPDDLYTFSYIESSGEPANVIGVFSSLQQCQKVENYAHDHSIYTKKCKKWESFVMLVTPKHKNK